MHKYHLPYLQRKGKRISQKFKKPCDYLKAKTHGPLLKIQLGVEGCRNFIQAKTNWPLIKIQLGIFAAIIFFHDRLQCLYDKYIVDTALQNFRSHWVGDIILGCIILYLIYDFLTKLIKNYQVTFNSLLTVAFIIFLYSKDRDEYNYYNILSISEFLTISYLETVLYFFGISQFAFFLHNIFKAIWPSKPSVVDAVGFVTDDPIKDISRDDLGRAKYANKISQQIIATKSLSSYAIGINGKWGSGKTSFVNLIEKEIKGQSKCYIWIKFNPWDSISRDNIVADFFKTLRNYISPYSSFLSDNLQEYSRLLGNISYGGIEFVLNPGSSNKTITDSFEKINSILEVLGKKLIISIDDMDRLQKEEIHQVIRLIRDTAAFANTIFIATYDKDYVSKAFEELSGNEAYRYLEKIFQTEIELPYIETIFLREEINLRLKKHLKNEYTAELDALISRDYKELFPIFDKFIITYRDAKRFINLFISPFMEIRNDVVFTDYFQLCLIKSKYPRVIEMLYHNQDVFFRTDDDILYLYTDYDNNNKESKLLVTLKESYNELTAKFLEESIKHLFPSPKSHAAEDFFNFRMEYRSANSIAYNYSFYRYFVNNIFSYDIKDDEYELFITKSLTEWLAKCVYWVDHGGRQSLFRMFDYKLYSSTDERRLENIVNAICHISCYQASFEKVYSPYKYDMLYRIFLNGHSQNGKWSINLFNQIVNNFDYIPFCCRFISDLLKNSDHLEPFLYTAKELLELNKNLLFNYLCNKNTSDENLRLLIQNSSYNLLNDEYIYGFNEELSDKLSSELKKKGLKFIANTIVQQFGPMLYRFDITFPLVYKDMEALKSIITSFPESNEKGEFILLIEELEKIKVKLEKEGNREMSYIEINISIESGLPNLFPPSSP